MFWIDSEKAAVLTRVMGTQPMAIAYLKGDNTHRDIKGKVSFYPVLGGTLFCIDVSGLPVESGSCNGKFFGMHIHEGAKCVGNEEDPFSMADGHYNPYNCEHPRHAGDLVPIFSKNGYAWAAFFTENFTVSEILGRTFIIHSSPDDFTTQPSGNSGNKIACGEIEIVM